MVLTLYLSAQPDTSYAALKASRKSRIQSINIWPGSPIDIGVERTFELASAEGVRSTLNSGFPARNAPIRSASKRFGRFQAESSYDLLNPADGDEIRNRQSILPRRHGPRVRGTFESRSAALH